MSVRCLTLLVLLPVLACASPVPEADPPAARAGAPSSPGDGPPATTADIPSEPLTGTINHVPVSGFRGFLDNGSFLKLYTGADPDFEHGTRVLLFADLDPVADRTVHFDADTGFGAWHIHFDSKERDDLSHMVMNGYRLDFTTGAEKDFTVRARLRLDIEGEFPVHLAGTVDVKTSGLVSRDGVIDLGHDHTDTIEYVAQQYVLRQHEGAEIAFRTPQQHSMQNGISDKARARGQVQEAYYSALYTVDDGPLQNRKMQLTKSDGVWSVHRELAAGEIRAAHPVNPPRADKPPYIYDAMAGAEFERTLYAGKHPWRKVKEPSWFSCGGGQKEGTRGYCKVAYGRYADDDLEQIECDSVVYLFDRVEGRWVLTETLPPDKDFNGRTNEVEERKEPPFGC